MQASSLPSGDFRGFYGATKLYAEQLEMLNRLKDNSVFDQDTRSKTPNFVCHLSPLLNPAALSLIYCLYCIKNLKKDALLISYRKKDECKQYLRELELESACEIEWLDDRGKSDAEYYLRTRKGQRPTLRIAHIDTFPLTAKFYPLSVVIMESFYTNETAIEVLHSAWRKQRVAQFVFITIDSLDEIKSGDGTSVCVNDARANYFCSMPLDMDNRDVHYYAYRPETTSIVNITRLHYDKDFLIIIPDLDPMYTDFARQNPENMSRHTIICANDVRVYNNAHKYLIIPLYNTQSLIYARYAISKYNSLQPHRHHVTVWLIGENYLITDLLASGRQHLEYKYYTGIRDESRFLENTNFPFSHFMIPQMYLFLHGKKTHRSLQFIKQILDCNTDVEQVLTKYKTQCLGMTDSSLESKPYFQTQACAYSLCLTGFRPHRILRLPRIESKKLFNPEFLYFESELRGIINKYDLRESDKYENMQRTIISHYNTFN
jgi:hypothetical protein